jgi:hypothetical protein
VTGGTTWYAGVKDARVVGAMGGAEDDRGGNKNLDGS